jgi:hypothetical protein
MLFAHYREVVTPEDAALYWAIAPLSETELLGSKQTLSAENSASTGGSARNDAGIRKR